MTILSRRGGRMFSHLGTVGGIIALFSFKAPELGPGEIVSSEHLDDSLGRLAFTAPASISTRVQSPWVPVIQPSADTGYEGVEAASASIINPDAVASPGNVIMNAGVDANDLIEIQLVYPTALTNPVGPHIAAFGRYTADSEWNILETKGGAAKAEVPVAKTTDASDGTFSYSRVTDACRFDRQGYKQITFLTVTAMSADGSPDLSTSYLSARIRKS